MRKAALRRLESQAMESFCRTSVQSAAGPTQLCPAEIELATQHMLRILRLHMAFEQLGPQSGVTRMLARLHGVTDLDAWLRWYGEVVTATRNKEVGREIDELTTMEPCEEPSA